MNETITNIPLGELHPFPDHPFGVRDDEAMEQTVGSIREYGVLVPAIARPREEGGYELIAGHRRKHACELAGLETMPVIVRDLDRNAAVIIMVDSNIQRENILPSERAKAYKMKLEAIKRQGARHDLTSTQIVQKLSVDKVAEEAGTNREQVRRYIRLNKLEPQLMQMVDEGKIGMTPAVEISYLKPDEQKLLIETIDSEQAKTKLYMDEHGLDYDAMSARKSELAKKEKELSAKITEAQNRIAEVNVLKTHIVNYSKTRDVYVAYRKSGYSKKYLEEHEDDIIIHKAAKKAFDELGVKKLPTIKSLQMEFAELLTTKKEAYAELKKVRDELRDIAVHTANYEELRDLAERDPRKEKEHGRE